MIGLIARIFWSMCVLFGRKVDRTSTPDQIYGTNVFGKPTTYNKDSFGSKLYKYELTGQMDGTKQVFDIDPGIKTGMATILRYGLLTFDEGDYIIDTVAHTLTTKFDSPPDNNDGRRLILVVNGDDSLGGSSTGGGTCTCDADFSELIDILTKEGYYK